MSAEAWTAAAAVATALLHSPPVTLPSPKLRPERDWIAALTWGYGLLVLGCAHGCGPPLAADDGDRAACDYGANRSEGTCSLGGYALPARLFGVTQHSAGGNRLHDGIDEVRFMI